MSRVWGQQTLHHTVGFDAQVRVCGFRIYDLGLACGVACAMFAVGAGMLGFMSTASEC